MSDQFNREAVLDFLIDDTCDTLSRDPGSLYDFVKTYWRKQSDEQLKEAFEMCAPEGMEMPS